MARLSVVLGVWIVVVLHAALALARQPYNLSQSLPMASTNFYPFEVHIARTSTTPGFWQPMYRDTVKGEWEHFAQQIVNWGVFEKHETQSYMEAIGIECRTNPNTVVLDVGGFNGYYTVIAALMGCKVQVWEAHPQNVQMVQMAVLLNRLWARVKVHHRICSNATGPLRFSGTGMDGHVSGTYNKGDNPNRLAEMKARGQEDDPNEGTLVYPLSLDDAVPEGKEVLLLKVDVEGHEPAVLYGAERLLRTRSIKKILMEYNMWRSMTLDEGVNLVGKILGFGYHVYLQPTEKCPQIKKVTDMAQMREVSILLRDNKYPCSMWTVYLLCTVQPLAFPASQ